MDFNGAKSNGKPMGIGHRLALIWFRIYYINGGGRRHGGGECGGRSRRKRRLVGRRGKGKGNGNDEVRTEVVPFMPIPKMYTTRPKRTIAGIRTMHSQYRKKNMVHNQWGTRLSLLSIFAWRCMGTYAGTSEQPFRPFDTTNECSNLYYNCCNN